MKENGEKQLNQSIEWRSDWDPDVMNCTNPEQNVNSGELEIAFLSLD